MTETWPQHKNDDSSLVGLLLESDGRIQFLTPVLRLKSGRYRGTSSSSATIMRNT